MEINTIKVNAQGASSVKVGHCVIIDHIETATTAGARESSNSVVLSPNRNFFVESSGSDIHTVQTVSVDSWPLISWRSRIFDNIRFRSNWSWSSNVGWLPYVAVNTTSVRVVWLRIGSCRSISVHRWLSWWVSWRFSRRVGWGSRRWLCWWISWRSRRWLGWGLSRRVGWGSRRWLCWWISWGSRRWLGWGLSWWISWSVSINWSRCHRIATLISHSKLRDLRNRSFWPSELDFFDTFHHLSFVRSNESIVVTSYTGIRPAVNFLAINI